MFVTLLLVCSGAFAEGMDPASTIFSLPAQTALPVVFSKSISSEKSHIGDRVTAKTTQIVQLPNGTAIPKGTEVVGHIVSLQAYQFDQTPYAHQKPSMLSIRFDTLQAGEAGIPINLSVRAIASPIDSREAAYPHSTDDPDHVGMMTLIGGTTFSPLDRMIQSDVGDAIAYNRRNGIFARLIAAGSCNGTDTEQSIAIFSPDACGAYGLGGAYLADSGQEGSGIFTLALRGHSVKLYAGSTALLQVNYAR
jgi:hypothetical protein